MKTLSVVTINQRESECQLCWNRTTVLRLEFKLDRLMRLAVGVCVLAALVCAWVAWSSHSEMSSASTFHKSIQEEGN